MKRNTIFYVVDNLTGNTVLDASTYVEADTFISNTLAPGAYQINKVTLVSSEVQHQPPVIVDPENGPIKEEDLTPPVPESSFGGALADSINRDVHPMPWETDKLRKKN